MSDQNNSLLDEAGISYMGNAVVVLFHTEWNHEIVDELARGCEATLQHHQVRRVVRVRVPGAVELSFACRRYYESTADGPDRPDAMILLGCVIRGGTPHFEYVCQTVIQGITGLNLALPVPVIFGVLTVDTPAQARERLGGSHGHKGKEAAITALKMISLNRKLG